MNKTATPLPSADQLITSLGGPVAVSQLLTTAGHPITSQAITSWKSAGIPTDRLVQIAFAKGRVIRSTTDIEPANWVRLFPELRESAKASKAG